MQTCPSCATISVNSAAACEQCGMPFRGHASPDSALAGAMLQMAANIRTIRHVAVTGLALSILAGGLVTFNWAIGGLHHDAAMTVTTPYADAPQRR